MLSMLGSVDVRASMERSIFPSHAPQAKVLVQEPIPDQATIDRVQRLINENLCDGQFILNNTGIGDAGAIALADALKTNTYITELDLEYNGIGVELQGRFQKIAKEKSIKFYF